MYGFAKPVFAGDPLKHNVKAATPPFFFFQTLANTTNVAHFVTV